MYTMTPIRMASTMMMKTMISCARREEGWRDGGDQKGSGIRRVVGHLVVPGSSGHAAEQLLRAVQVRVGAG